MITKVIKNITQIEIPIKDSPLHGQNYGAPLNGRGYASVSFWDYTIMFEDDEIVYKMTRTAPVESEYRGLNVGDTVSFKLIGDRIKQVKVIN